MRLQPPHEPHVLSDAPGFLALVEADGQARLRLHHIGPPGIMRDRGTVAIPLNFGADGREPQVIAVALAVDPRVCDLVWRDHDGQPVGLLGIAMRTMHSWYVSPASRRLGIGAALVRHAVENGLADRFHSVFTPAGHAAHTAIAGKAAV